LIHCGLGQFCVFHAEVHAAVDEHHGTYGMRGR
jgi:hypothetical protein